MNDLWINTEALVVYTEQELENFQFDQSINQITYEWRLCFLTFILAVTRMTTGSAMYGLTVECELKES